MRKNWQLFQYFSNSMTSGGGSCITHSVRAWKIGRHFELPGPKAFAKRAGMMLWGFFLTCRAPKIPSSLNKPVLDYNIVGKTSEKESAKVRIMTDWWPFSTTSATWTIIFMSDSIPCEQNCKTYLSVSVCCCGFFSQALLSWDPVSSCWTHRDKIYVTYQTTYQCGSNSISHVKMFPVSC